METRKTRKWTRSLHRSRQTNAIQQMIRTQIPIPTDDRKHIQRAIPLGNNREESALQVRHRSSKFVECLKAHERRSRVSLRSRNAVASRVLCPRNDLRRLRSLFRPERKLQEKVVTKRTRRRYSFRLRAAWTAHPPPLQMRRTRRSLRPQSEKTKLRNRLPSLIATGAKKSAAIQRRITEKKKRSGRREGSAPNLQCKTSRSSGFLSLINGTMQWSSFCEVTDLSLRRKTRCRDRLPQIKICESKIEAVVVSTATAQWSGGLAEIARLHETRNQSTRLIRAAKETLGDVHLSVVRAVRARAAEGLPNITVDHDPQEGTAI